MSDQFINPYRLFVGSFIPNWLLVRREISPGAKLTYGRLAQHADKKSGVAWPSRKTLACELGISPRQIDRYLSALLGAGLIKIQRTGFKKSNRYRFLFHRWMQVYESPHLSTHELTNPTTQDSTDLSTKKNHWKRFNVKETGAGAPGLVDKSKQGFRFTRKLSPELKDAANALYRSDSRRFARLPKWIRKKREGEHNDADIAAALLALREREVKYGSVDNWWGYLEGTNGTGQTMVDRKRTQRLQIEAAAYKKPGPVKLGDLPGLAALAAVGAK